MKLIDRVWFHTNTKMYQIVEYHEWVNNIIAFASKNEMDNRLEEILRMSETITYDDFDTIVHDAVSIAVNFFNKDILFADYIDHVMVQICNMMYKEKMTLTDTRRPLRFIIHDS